MSDKRDFSRLRILGGPKAFVDPVHVGRPNIGDSGRVLQLVEQALRRKWLSNDGPLVQTLECMIKERVGVDHVVATSNATIALELSLRATCPHGEVIVPSYTFIATAHAAKWCGYTPVFADVALETHHLDTSSIEQRISERTVAIMPVHLWGACQAAPQIEALAVRLGLPLLFDAAHAFSCSAEGRSVGTFGTAEIFSFHATKFVNCGEGGAISTNDGDLAKKLRLMRNFGFTGYDRVEHLGTNAKMSEFSAAMGIACLENIECIVQINRENWEAYSSYLQGIPGLSLHQHAPNSIHNYQYVIVEVDEMASGLSRDELVAVLHEENVFARRYFAPGCHLMEPYKSISPYTGDLPNTTKLAATVMALPTGTSVNPDCISQVARILREAVSQSGSVKEALKTRVPPAPPVPTISGPLPNVYGSPRV